MKSGDQKSMVLSIGITSCNHADVISRAIDGVLIQETDFPCELILCDDASDDGTRELLMEYACKHPELIRTSFSESRLGPILNGKTFFSLASGKYLCWLDADDCWTYPHKLQKQIDFLNTHEAYSGCFHDASIITDFSDQEKNAEYTMRFHHQWKTYSQFNTYPADFFPWDALMRRIIPTASLVFRRTDLSSFFELFKDHRLSISWALHLWLLKDSKFRYFNEVWSVYHDHPDGFSKKHSLKEFKINNISILEHLLSDPYYCELKNDVYRALVNEYYHLLSIPEISVGHQTEMKNHLKKFRLYSKELLSAETVWFRSKIKDGG